MVFLIQQTMLYAVPLIDVYKRQDFTLGDLPEFVDRLKDISKNYGMNFVVSLSAEKEEMIGVNFEGCEILN